LSDTVIYDRLNGSQKSGPKKADKKSGKLLAGTEDECYNTHFTAE